METETYESLTIDLDTYVNNSNGLGRTSNYLCFKCTHLRISQTFQVFHLNRTLMINMHTYRYM